MKSKNLFVIKISLYFLILLIFMGCMPYSSNPTIQENNNYSKFSSINIDKLPDIKDLSSKDNANKLLNAYALKIMPTDPNCANATKIQTIKPYTDSTIDVKLYTQCNYELTFKLGCKKSLNQDAQCDQKSNNNDELDEVYFELAKAYQISSQELQQAAQNQKPLNIQLTLALTLEGILRDFKIPSNNTTNQNNNNSGQTSTNTPILAPLFSELKLINKQNQNISVADIFKGKYILMVFSMQGCGPCETLASRIKNDSDMLKLHQEQKCTIVTIHPNFENIQTRYDTAFNLHKSGFSTNFFDSFNAKIKGAEIYATPTSLMMSTDGTLKHRFVGDQSAILTTFKNLCSQ